MNIFRRRLSSGGNDSNNSSSPPSRNGDALAELEEGGGNRTMPLRVQHPTHRTGRGRADAVAINIER